MSPELTSIVSCANTDGTSYTQNCKEPPCGQLNPSSTLMYQVLGAVLQDVAMMFSSGGNKNMTLPFVHLGFDEVDSHCWTSDPTVAEYMAKNHLNLSSLLAEFFIRERALLAAADASSPAAIYWDEVVSQGLHKKLRANDIVQFWHAGNSGLLEQYLKETNVTNTAVLSAYTSYYLDCGTGNEFGEDSWCDPLKTWRTMYFNDPLVGVDPSLWQGRIRGGEAALWTEVASAGSLDSKLWPRAASYGARLWDYGVKHVDATTGWVEVELDLAAHASRLLARGIGSDQITPEFCQQQPHLCFPSSLPSV